MSKSMSLRNFKTLPETARIKLGKKLNHSRPNKTKRRKENSRFSGNIKWSPFLTSSETELQGGTTVTELESSKKKKKSLETHINT